MNTSDNMLHADNTNLAVHCEPSDNNYARKVVTGSLLTVAWLVFAPLMYLINRKNPLLSKKQLLWHNIFSPLTGTVLSLIILLFTLPSLSSNISFEGISISSFPELTDLMNPPYDFWQLLLTAYFLPVYAFCVLFLFLTMALTGWSYADASIYICQLAAQAIYTILPIISIVLILVRHHKSKGTSIWGTIFYVVFICIQAFISLFQLLILSTQITIFNRGNT
ncbi:MAG: hypothetical protein K2J82_09960 [Muribaculaceae bacterium]|nr:hypothetical protein [Muribaculaceae bacterium]